MDIIRKEYFEITWGSLRAMVEPAFAERMVIKHSDYLTNVEIVASTATNLTAGEVFTADGRSFVYDYLVIATGHKDLFPETRAERLAQYQAGQLLTRYYLPKFIKVTSRTCYCQLVLSGTS